MVNEIYTAHYRYAGPDRIDITAKRKTLLSPKWDLVNAFKSGAIDEDSYTLVYESMLQERYTIFPSHFHSLYLEKPRIVLVCFCPRETFCHRVLAANFLVSISNGISEYKGELVI